MSRLDAIEARDRAATAGPWAAWSLHPHCGDNFGLRGPDDAPVALDDGMLFESDAEWIAHARADLPWAVGLVRRLEEYAQHGARCEWWMRRVDNGPSRPGPCTCGLDALLKEIRS